VHVLNHVDVFFDLHEPRQLRGWRGRLSCLGAPASSCAAWPATASTIGLRQLNRGGAQVRAGWGLRVGGRAAGQRNRAEGNEMASHASPTTCQELSVSWRIDFARSRTPLRSVRFLLERRAEEEWLIQVRGIFDDTGHHDPLIAVRLVVAVEVLGENGALAVGNAVLPKVAGFHVG